MKRSAKADEILDIAEKYARQGGYNSFSFREIASAVGVKSASVHYHFPTKEDLGAALARRYAERAAERLGDPTARDPAAATAGVAALFRESLAADEAMCLCGLFGAERDALPPEVRAEVARYFRMVLDYLGAAYGEDWAGPPPEAVLARFEGALILARALDDPAVFDVAIGETGG